MYWADTTILVLLLVGTIFGAISGLLWQVFRIVGFGLSLGSALYFHEWANNLLTDVFFRGADARIPWTLAYLVVFTAVYLLLFGITLLLERTIKAARLQPLNRLAGAGLGALKTALILSAVFLCLANFPHPRTREIMQKSVLAPPLAEALNLLIYAAPAEYREGLQNGLKGLRESARPKA